MSAVADIVLINPGDKKQVYQGLAFDMAAIEPPYWAAALAGYVRKKGFTPAIIDANAENLSPEETARRAKQYRPLLAAVIVYGSQPSASTQNMTAAVKICAALRKSGLKTAIGGLHPTALPRRTIEETNADFLVEGEGPLTLHGLLDAVKGGQEDYSKIPGLWYLSKAGIINNPRAELIKDLDISLPAAAWDLLPMSLYRAHNWHCFDNIEHRSPYAAIYTSLGCPFGCVFCCINSLFAKRGIRYRGPSAVLDEIGVLSEKYNIKNIKIADELFVFNEKHYMPIVEGIIERKYPLNIWAYARVDTVNVRNLGRMKKAGINWLALGIESAAPEVRDGAHKKLSSKDIRMVVSEIQGAGIRVIGNFMFGLPEDTFETMQQTLDLAMELNCEFVNFYCAMAYPGSRLYEIAVSEKWELPKQWHGFSQHSYEMLPLPTKHLKAAEVLKFRDDAFHKYFENPSYLDMVEKKFGADTRRHIAGMTGTRIKRRILQQ